MADPFIQHYLSSMGSIEELQNTCITDETGSLKKLKSLAAAIDDHGTKVTEAVYEEDGLEGLGDFTIEAFSQGKAVNASFEGTAFILTQVQKVLVFRS